MRNEEHRVAVFSSALPFGWVTATIGDIIGFDGLFVDGDWVESKDQDPKGDVKLTQLADVGDGVYRNRSNRFLKYEKAVQLGCTFLQPNDLMVARMPDPLGRACIFPGDSKPSVTAVDVCIVRTGLHGADHHWLMYIINSPIFRLAIASLQSGSTRKRISRSNLAKLEFPLPPLPEQHHIVAKIEELFTKLDAGVKALKKIKTQLKRYRQSVLKSAMEGKLTEKWRRTHKDELEPASVLLEGIREERQKKAKGKYKELPPLDTKNLPELPERWAWTTVGEIGEVVTGTTPSKTKQEYYGSDYPFFKPTDLNAGYYVRHSRDGLSKEGLKHARLLPEKCILVTCIGATIGKTGFIRVAGTSNQQINALIPEFKFLLPEFIYFLFISPQINKSIIDNSSSTTLPILNKSRFERLFIPLTPLSEQNKIVEEIERRLSVTDEIEKVVELSLKQAERLRQSLLKKAFEGKLVPQDPTNEPASILLERIKKEKEKLDVERKSKRKSRKKKHKKYVQKGLM